MRIDAGNIEHVELTKTLRDSDMLLCRLCRSVDVDGKNAAVDATSERQESKRSNQRVRENIHFFGNTENIFTRLLSFQFSRGIREDESGFSLIQACEKKTKKAKKYIYELIRR